ncbi:MAG TPA: threonine--tRNA ligase [Candidatus Paceibacterota bacterium]
MEHHENLSKIRHSLAHLLAAAVLEIYPKAKPTIGPAIDNGFYYDFDDLKISDSDLAKIETKMKELLPNWTEFTHKEVKVEEAKTHFKSNRYKVELIDDIEKAGEKITFYTCGGFTDLCRGGHSENPSEEIKPDAFKLSRIAGAYWRGDEQNKMLSRIYGLAFPTKKELEDYEKILETAKSRDHKKLGRELDLFTFSEFVGAGLPLWTPKGTILRDLLDGFVWELRQKAGYERVDIPHITKKELYEKSGHWQKFGDQLFKITTREKHTYVMKPMNCPHHTQIYARKMWSYRELPQRYASTTKVYRDEQSGELSGLSRVLAITQDDAHVFCRNSEVKEEILKIWEIIKTFYGAAGFELIPRLSLHDSKKMDKYLGTESVWMEAEAALRDIVKEKGETAEEAMGEAAFYGPKVDFMAKDSLGREWQVATVQLDMNLPERFDLYCINEKGEKERIVMIHAAIMGSIERYLSILIEHYAGAFPLWLSPVQVTILPISVKHESAARETLAALRFANIRAELSDPNESLGKRVRETKLQKTPYWLVIGDKDIAANVVTLESRSGEKQELAIEKVVEKLVSEISTRS